MKVLQQISKIVEQITRWTKIANVASKTIEFFHEQMKENFPNEYKSE